MDMITLTAGFFIGWILSKIWRKLKLKIQNFDIFTGPIEAYIIGGEFLTDCDGQNGATFVEDPEQEYLSTDTELTMGESTPSEASLKSFESSPNLVEKKVSLDEDDREAMNIFARTMEHFVANENALSDTNLFNHRQSFTVLPRAVSQPEPRESNTMKNMKLQRSKSTISFRLGNRNRLNSLNIDRTGNNSVSVCFGIELTESTEFSTNRAESSFNDFDFLHDDLTHSLSNDVNAGSEVGGGQNYEENITLNMTERDVEVSGRDPCEFVIHHEPLKGDDSQSVCNRRKSVEGEIDLPVEMRDKEWRHGSNSSSLTQGVQKLPSRTEKKKKSSNKPSFRNRLRKSLELLGHSLMPNSQSQMDMNHVFEENYYSMPTATKHQPVGLFLIFNHEQFERQLARSGSQIDTDRLKQTLESYGMEVRVFKDLRADEVIQQVSTVSKELELAKYSCFGVVVLTHGTGEHLYGYSGEYSLNSLYEPFMPSRCPSLSGKPKLFFFQACRGPSRDSQYQVDYPHNQHLPEHADFLFAYSSPNGYVSYRDPNSGSPFIQNLCNVWNERLNTSIIDILTETCRKVCDEFITDTLEKQCPSYTSMLRKILVFKKM